MNDSVGWLSRTSQLTDRDCGTRKTTRICGHDARCVNTGVADVWLALDHGALRSILTRRSVHLDLFPCFSVLPTLSVSVGCPLSPSLSLLPLYYNTPVPLCLSVSLLLSSSLFAYHTDARSVVTLTVLRRYCIFVYNVRVSVPSGRHHLPRRVSVAWYFLVCSSKISSSLSTSVGRGVLLTTH